LTLKQRLKHARTVKADTTGTPWTQKHLAEVAGVSLATIGMMETGQRGQHRDRPPGTLPAIAKALGVCFDWLARGDLPMRLPASTKPVYVVFSGYV
jgi:transcriptional regulator with XRE-family HTH domain